MQYARILVAIVAMLLTVLSVSCSKDDNPVDNNNDGDTPDGMVLIQAEDMSFQMGSDSGYADEQPVHNVSFTHDFWMDTTEVTQGNYDTLMSQSYEGYTTPSWFGSYGVGHNYPAYFVYWGDAALYCNARSRRDGLDTVYSYTAIIGTPGNPCELEGVEVDFSKSGYRLPTEAEWEFACRGGITSDFFWGENFNPYPSTAADTAQIDSHTVWYANSWQYGSEDERYGAHQVAGTSPNDYGLYDMVGNLYEWCNDWYGDYSGEITSDPIGPDSGEWHCLRGGSWGNQAFLLRSANRTFQTPDYLYYFIGFRVVLPVQ